MKIKGITVDTAAIGAGIYKMIEERGEDAIVAYGMIPHHAIEALRTALRAKIIASCEANQGCSTEEFFEACPAGVRENVREGFETELARILREIERHVCVGIYSAAKAAGKMVV